MRIIIEVRRPARRSPVLLLGLLLLALPAVALAGHQFADVPGDHPFHTEIGAIAKAGITGGFSDGTYRPGDPVSRQAMAAFMHRGFGRAGLAIGGTPMTASVNVPASALFTSLVPVRQLTITVPGASNAFSPKQLVHLRGDVHLNSSMSREDGGCPCEFVAAIRNMSTGGLSIGQLGTFESASSNPFYYSFDIEALFAATPGTRTFQLEVRLSWRDANMNAASFNLSSQSSLSATTFPFGPAGTDSLSSTGAQNVGLDVDQLPERRRDE